MFTRKINIHKSRPPRPPNVRTTTYPSNLPSRTGSTSHTQQNARTTKSNKSNNNRSNTNNSGLKSQGIHKVNTVVNSCKSGSSGIQNNTKISLFDTLRLAQLKAHEDEKSLCHGDWRNDYSLDRPTYGSILFQIKEANNESEGSCEFVRKTAEILASTVLVTILLSTFMALPVGMVTIGVKYLHECPKEPKIPIYLLVGGCFGLLKLMSLLWKQVKSRQYERLDELYDAEEDNGDIMVSKSSKFSETVLSLFLFSWFICGNYWTLHIWKPDFIQPLHEPNNWCDKTVYMFAVIQIFGCYALMGVIMILTIILAICHSYSTTTEEKT